MAFENSTTASGQQQIIAPTPNWMALIAGILFCGLAIALGYIIWYKNQTIEVISNKINQEKSVPAVIRDTAQQNELQRELEAANVRYDMLKMLDAQKDTANNLLDSDIQDKKARITELLSKVSLTQAELTEAKSLIASLKTNLDGYKVQTQKLADDKVSLMQEKDDVAKQRDKVQAQVDSATEIIKEKEDTIEIGSTLEAVNFGILSIADKSNGKEKETSVARHVDKLRISFEIGENRIASDGVKTIYVCVTDPDGLPVAAEALGSGKFSLRSGDDKFYTQKLDINYIQGSRQEVSFDWKQNTNFESGDYRIEVFNNGFEIGDGLRHLK